MSALVEDFAGALLVAGSLGCLVAAVATGPRRAALLLATGLALAAAGEFSDGSGAVPLLAVLAVAAGLVALVLEHFERVPRLSWLDAIMGAATTAALVDALGAG